MMKMLVSLSRALLLSVILTQNLCAEEDSPKPFLVETDLPRASIFPVGAEISFKILLRFPDTYSYQGSSIYAYLFNLPGNFVDVTGKEINTDYYGKKWAAVRIKPMVWLPAAQRKLREHTGSFSTQGWPPGDYCLTLSGFFQGSNREDKLPDKYVSTSILFSLE